MDILLSDVHSPIILSLDIFKKSPQDLLDIPYHRNECLIQTDISYENIQTNWQTERKNEYLSCFDLECINKLYSDLNEIIDSNYVGITQVVLDDKISSLEKILLGPSVRCGFSKTRVTNTKINTGKTNKNKPWFDNNCKQKRKEYFRLRKILKKSSINDDRLRIEAKRYKNFIRNTSCTF